jgi:hypothetical protein
VGAGRRYLVSDRVQTIFGDQHRPQRDTRKRNPTRWGVVVEKPDYDTTIFKVHYGKMTWKIYSKGEHILRIEVIVLRSLTALLVLREKIILPLLAASSQPEPPDKPAHPVLLDQHYETLRVGMHDLFTDLGIAA